MTRFKKDFFVFLMIFGLFFSAAFFGCANPMAPQGGPRDTLPPQILDINPGNFSVHFKDKKIYVKFDEYIKLSNLQQEFYTSPFMEKNPLATIKGKELVIEMKSTPDSATTYMLDFGKSIVDNNEGNPLSGFRYLFSTGDHIDSLLMSALAIDAQKKDSLDKTYILFFDPIADSMAYDSVLFKSKPLAVARTLKNGLALAKTLKNMPYKVYAMQDKNSNKTYEPGTDRVGFLDTLINPFDLPEFDIIYDTTVYDFVALPHLTLHLFEEKQKKRQNLSDTKRPLRNKLIFTFNDAEPEIKRFNLEGIDMDSIIIEANPTRDTIVYWLAVEQSKLRDTLLGNIVYVKPDSLGALYDHDQKLKLFFTVPKKETKRNKNEKEPNPFGYKSNLQRSLNPTWGYYFEFDQPLKEFDSTRVIFEELMRKDEKDLNPVGLKRDIVFNYSPDHKRRLEFSYQWQEGKEYRMIIPAGTFVNIAGQSNDTIRMPIEVQQQSKFATVIVKLKAASDTAQYVLQLLDASSRLIEEIPHATAGEHKFNFVTPGKIRLRVIEDKNGNGKWDNGNLVQRIKPEKVEVPLFKGSPDIVTRADWEEEIEIDAVRLFNIPEVVIDTRSGWK